MALKIMSLNIEYSLHLDRFPQVVRQENPDVLCLQEVCEYDLEKIAQRTGMEHYTFLERIVIEPERAGIMKRTPWGLAIFARSPFDGVAHRIFRPHDPERRKKSFLDDPRTSQEALDLAGIVVTYVKDDEEFTIGTTHFTWSLVSETDLQLSDARRLMNELADIPELVLCGDFNVPRGQNKTYDVLTERFIDGIPERYTMSIDKNLHKAGKNLEHDHLMVDYIFHTPGYSVANVRLIDGVSDHMAVVGEISPA